MQTCSLLMFVLVKTAGALLRSDLTHKTSFLAGWSLISAPDGPD